MDDLAFVRKRIESYADYTNNDARQLTDEQIRAYVGEALARLRERLPLGEAALEVFGRLLLRCQFADQRIVRKLDISNFGEAEKAAVRAADRTLVELAERADSLDLAAVDGYLAEVDAALEARARIIIKDDSATP